MRGRENGLLIHVYISIYIYGYVKRGNEKYEEGGY
jgi:hypothetical protein